MADPFYAWHVGDLRTGRLTAEVPVSEAAWQVVMDDAGALSFTTILTDAAVRLLDLYTSAEPCRCFLAVAYTDAQGNETFLEAGPVWTHSYDSASGKLQVSGAGLWSYYDHRKILPVLTAGTNPATIVSTFTAAPGTIAKQLLELAHTHTGGAVPVVFPDDEAGTDTWSYSGFDMAAVGEALRDVTKLDAGPEIQFVPRRRGDDPRYLEWVMLAGTAAAPLLTQDGEDLVFDQSAARSQVTSVTVSRDGSAAANRWWTQGAGTDISTKFSRADDTTFIDAGFPLLEGNDARGDVADQALLDRYAAGALAAKRRPVDTFTIAAHCDGTESAEGARDWSGPNPGSCRVGSWVNVTIGGWTDPATRTVPKEPYLAPAGDTRAIRGRITSVAGDLTTALTLALAPEVEA